MTYWTGKYKNYYWFEMVSGHELTLWTLIKYLPEMFLGKYLAVAFFDSGPLIPSEEERRNGWTSKNGIMYSQKITLTDLEFAICDNYDQWYLFDEPTEIPKVDDYVNYDNFSLQDKLNKWVDLQKSFWTHIEKVRPTIFILDGVRLIYVTKDENEIKKIKHMGTTKSKNH